MAENYKHLYEQTKKMLTIYQDELIPGYRKQIEELEVRNKWIPVTERVPEEHDWVLAACKLVPEWFYGVPHIAELRNGRWWADHGDFPLDDIGVKVTHWMPLPESPNHT